MSTAILKKYNKLLLEEGSNQLSIVTPSPNASGSTKIKRWWRKSYEETTYEGCALIDYENVYIVVSCSNDVELKINTDGSELEFDVGFNKLGDGNVRRILVVPKEELYNPVNYEDYYYDYSTKSFIKTVHGNGSDSGFINPNLQLNFAENLSLVDDISGNNLITYTRASIATYVDANGVLQTATANTPRFDHDPVTGESLGLLIEESRRNKAQQSEDLSVSPWEKISGATVTSSSVTAPDGVSNMWLVDLSNTAGTTTAGSRVYQGNLAFNSAVNTFSFYARSVSGSGSFPVAYYDGTNYIKSYIDLTETTKRYSISCPAGITTTSNNIFGFTRRGTTHNETLTQAYVWGAQVEEGPFATSYIPSISGATREPDIAEITGADFSAFHNPLEGTYFIDVEPSPGSSSSQARGFVVSDGTDSHRIATNFKAPNPNNLFFVTGGAVTALASNIAGLPRRIRAAVAYKAGDYRGAYDGQLASASSQSQVPNVNQLSIGSASYRDNGYFNSHIRQFSYYNTRIDDASLPILTGLWTPAELPGLQLWLDASDATTITQSSGIISQWDDKSGNGNHATQSIGSSQPSYGTSTIYGKNVVDFGGVKFMTTGCTPGLNRTIAAVIQYSTTAGLKVFAGARQTTNERSYIGVNSGKTRAGVAELTSLAGDVLAIDTTYTQILSHGQGAVNREAHHYLDGTEDVAPDTFTGDIGSGVNYMIGGFNDQGSVHNSRYGGLMGELVITDDMLSDSNRQKLEGYFAHGWGHTASLEANHPYKSAPPLK